MHSPDIHVAEVERLRHITRESQVGTRLDNSGTNDVIETLCSKHHHVADPYLDQVRTALAPLLKQFDANQTGSILDPFGDDKLQMYFIRFGIAGDTGLVVVGSRRVSFPSEHDRVVLSVGANQAAVVVHRQRVEEALRVSEEKYRALFSEMAKTNKHLSEFLAVLAHELRNPLAPVLTGLEIIRMRPDSPETVLRVRDMIERQANQMVILINELLDIARVTNGKIEIKKKPVDLHSIISSAVEASLPTIEAARHELSVRLGEKPLRLNADSTRIIQVISNLLTNAAKYTPQCGKIELIAEQDKNDAVISVKDNGIGIPLESLSSIFEMFSQVKRDIDHSQGGLGIGLALVRNLVILHGGKVIVTSEGVGKGSTFTVRLPLDQTNEQHNLGNLPQISGETSQRTFRILVVDDNTDAAQSLADLLRMYGHDVRIAENGEKALQIAKEFHVEVAFLDIGMPNMS
ncbi:MAG: response regulator, partial [Proteobacteria bacterium]